MSSNDYYNYFECYDKLNLEKIKSSFEVNKLVGFTKYTEEESENILDFVTCIIRDDIRELKKVRKVAFVALVELAKRWKSVESEENDDSGFWDYVANSLEAVENKQNVRNSFVQAINSLESHNEIVTVKTGHRYYATILMHSFAPFNSMRCFFELCFNVFKKDLDYSYTNSDKWICEFIAVRIGDILNQGYSEEYGVSIGSEVYFFNIGLKSFASHEQLFDDFVGFIDKVLKAINEMYYYQTFCQDDWVDERLQYWWKHRNISDEEVKHRHDPIVSRQDFVVDYVKKDDNQVYLRIPSIGVEENDCIQVRISSDEKVLRCDYLRKKIGMFFFSTITSDYCLNDLCNNWSGKINVRVELLVNDSVIFDSDKDRKTSLRRDFILFKNEGEVKGVLQEPNNYFVFSGDVDSLKTYPNEIEKVAKNLYNVYPKSGESLTGEFRQVSFVERQQMSQNRGQLRLVGYMGDAKWMYNEQLHSVFKDNVKLLVPSFFNLRSLELKINEKLYMLSTLNFENEDDDRVFGLCRLGLISDCRPVKLSVFSYDYNKEVLSDFLVAFPKLSINFNHPFFYGSQQRNVHVSYDAKIIDEQCFDNNVDEIEIPMFNGLLCLRVPLLQWRINKGEWQNRGVEGIRWYEDYIKREDELEIRCSQQNGFKLIVICDGEEQNVHKVKENCYLAGRSVYHYQEVKELCLSIMVGENSYPIMSLSMIEGFLESPFSCRENKVYWDVSNTFVGKKTDCFNAVFSNGKTKIEKKMQNVNCEIEIPDGGYVISVFKMFLFGLKNLGTFNLVVGDEEKYRFNGKKLRLIQFRDYERKSNMHNFGREYYLDDLEGYYDEEEKQYYYLGRLCQRVGDELRIVEKLEDERGIKQLVNPVRIDLRNNITMWIKAGWKENGDFIEDLFYDLDKKRLCINESNLPRYIQMLYIRFKEE